jgi:hypothetical protein
VVAGDITQWLGLNCATGVGGQVQITVNGNVIYKGPATGALTPVVNGNVFTYPISDFATVNNGSDFRLIFQVATTAQAGDSICVHASVTPVTGDNNPGNNTFSFCYEIVNSYDPNKKEVYPTMVPAGYSNWFTYTIYFQNTGNAPAINITIKDTMDNLLNLTTLQIMYSSHN